MKRNARSPGEKAEASYCEHTSIFAASLFGNRGEWSGNWPPSLGAYMLRPTLSLSVEPLLLLFFFLLRRGQTRVLVLVNKGNIKFEWLFSRCVACVETRSYHTFYQMSALYMAEQPMVICGPYKELYMHFLPLMSMWIDKMTATSIQDALSVLHLAHSWNTLAKRAVLKWAPDCNLVLIFFPYQTTSCT